MPFNSLFLNKLIIKETHFTEQGKRVSIRPKDRETVLFYPIDTDNDNTFKEFIGIGEGKICDLIVTLSAPERLVICFVELKGGGIEHASKQLINTYKHFKKAFQKHISNSSCGKHLPGITWKAYIGRSKAVLKNIKETEETLKEVFHDALIRRAETKGKTNKKKFEFDEFLRK